MAYPRTDAGAPAPAIVACLATLAIFESIFRASLTSAAGEIAAPFAYVLPRLYDGALWFRANGPISVPWFTPSFCGGLPAYGNPANDYFSVPQLVDSAAGPLAAIHATALAFCAIGFFGFYRLVRDVFYARPGAGAFAGALFALNGFFLWRMVAGELSVHAFMLTPLVAWGTLVPMPADKRGALLARDTCVAGAAIAYAIHAGAIDVLPLITLSVLAIALIHGASSGAHWATASEIFARFLGALAIGAALAAGKLSAMLSFFAHTTRPPAVALPGVRSVRDLLELVLVPLFARPRLARLEGVLVNPPSGWNGAQIELGVGLVPPVILAVGLLVGPVVIALRLKRGELPGGGARVARSLAWCAALLFVLAVPLYLNVHDPEVARIARALPIVRNERELFRLLSVFVPVVILASALIVDRLLDWRAHWVFAVAAVAVLLLGDRAHDAARDFDEPAGYSPAPIELAHATLRETRVVPSVQAIAPIALNPSPAYPQGQTAAGVSTYPCFEPAFGYLMESFPKNELRPGPVSDVTERRFNLLDPSCFVFPDENGCAPGDRLSVEDKDRFQHFRAHEAFAFMRPWWQRLADATSFVALAVVLVVFLAWLLADKNKAYLS